MAKKQDQGHGRIAEAKAAIAAKESEILDLEQRVNAQFAEVARLQAEVDRNPTAELLAQLESTTELARRLRAGLPGGGRTVKPQLELEMERLKAELERLRSQRISLAREIYRIELLERQWGEVIGELATTTAWIRNTLDRRSWPEHISQQELLKLWGWATRTRDEISNLPVLRQRLADFGDDPGHRLPDFELEETAQTLGKSRADGRVRREVGAGA